MLDNLTGAPPGLPDQVTVCSSGRHFGSIIRDKEATEAREAKAAMTGELKALKSHNEQLAALLAVKS